MTRIDVRSVIGDPRALSREIAAYREAATVLSSKESALIERFARQWVAVVDQEVVAHAKSLKAVLRKLETLRISPSKALVRYIEKNQRTFIL